VFVAIVWAGMVASTSFYVARYGTAMPKNDDLTQLHFLVPGASINWTWAWAQHYEHRMPIPRFLFHELVEITRDFRTGTWIEVFLLAALSLAMILAARRIRGRASYTDAFFPLVWLHWGHSETLLNSFQLQVVLSTVLWCTAFLVIVRGSPQPTFRALCAIVACALLLPLCGMFGVLENAALVLWLACAGYALRRSSAAGARRSSNAAFAGAVAVTLLVAGYFVDFQWPASPPRTDLLLTLTTTAQFLAAGAGSAGQDAWPWSSCIALALCAASAALLARVVRRDAQERMRALGLLCCMASIGCLALAIGWGRGIDQPRAGFLSRYAVASAPILCVAYFAWTRYGPPEWGRFVRVALCSAAIAFASFNIQPAAAIGEERTRNALALTRDIDSGWLLSDVSRRHWHNFLWEEDYFTQVLQEMRDAGLGPFARAPGSPSGPAWHPIPVRIESRSPSRNPAANDKTELLVEAPSCVHLPLRPEEHSIRGQFGIPDPLADNRRSRRLRVVIELVAAGTGPVTLLERILDANTVESDRKPQVFELELPAHAAGEILLRTQSVDEAEAGSYWSRWSSWSAVEIR
jgi:hypothetical protein